MILIMKSAPAAGGHNIVVSTKYNTRIKTDFHHFVIRRSVVFTHRERTIIILFLDVTVKVNQ